MKLSQLLEGVAVTAGLSEGAAEMEVRGLEYDSRRVEAGFVFFAFPERRPTGGNSPRRRWPGAL